MGQDQKEEFMKEEEEFTRAGYNSQKMGMSIPQLMVKHAGDALAVS